MRQVVFLPDGEGGYSAEVPSLPGCHAKGKNLKEAMRNIRMAVYRHIEGLDALRLPIPESMVVKVPNSEGMVHHNLLLREDVIRAVLETFPDQALHIVLGPLDECGKGTLEIELEYLHMAIIRLSGGRLDKLHTLVADAKRDPRDVLSGYAKQFGKQH